MPGRRGALTRVFNMAGKYFVTDGDSRSRQRQYQLRELAMKVFRLRASRLSSEDTGIIATASSLAKTQIRAI